MKVPQRILCLYVSLIILLFLCIVTPTWGLTEIINVHIKGVGDGVKTTE